MDIKEQYQLVILEEDDIHKGIDQYHPRGLMGHIRLGEAMKEDNVLLRH